MSVESLAWCLPRPRATNKYPGGFPAFFEKKLLAELSKMGLTNLFYPFVLHPFGGRAEYGLRVDVRREVAPDVLADAHQLPFADESFDAVILDPPYDDHYSQRLYTTSGIQMGKAVKEAVRVAKTGGFVVLYHMVSFPVPAHCILIKRILLETQLHHSARIVHIHLKDAEAYHEKGRKMGATCRLCK